jgi:outer membrane protein assembly factor BamE (lipoprotein component of BamABCDE complex)
LALLVFFLLTPLVLLGWYQATRVDIVASWIYPSDTVYASQFSRQEFKRVAAGMSMRELIERLGEPIDRRAIGERQEYWHYSQPGKRFQNYWNFIVIVDPKTEKVVECFREFYTD